MRSLAPWLALLLLGGVAVPLVALGDETEEAAGAAAPEAAPAPEATPAEATPAEPVAEPEAAAEEAEPAAEAEATDEAEPTEEAEAEPEEEDEEESALGEYGASAGNRFLMGLNSTITAPADPVMSAVKPDKEFDDLPLAVVTKWPVGFVQGTLLMGYRAVSGLLDMTFSPLTPMKMLSPEPRYMLFPNVEHEEY